MTVNVTPYLHFPSGAIAAMELYRSVLGGELTRMTFGQNGTGRPEEADKTMHSQLDVDGTAVLMASDVPEDVPGGAGGNGSISLSGGAAEAEDLRRCFAALSASGSVTVPLATAPWGDSFGMCVDGFGVTWMVNIAGA